MPLEVSINTGVMIGEDFQCLPRRILEGISGVFLGDAKKAVDEKTGWIEH